MGAALQQWRVWKIGGDAPWVFLKKILKTYDYVRLGSRLSAYLGPVALPKTCLNRALTLSQPWVNLVLTLSGRLQGNLKLGFCHTHTAHRPAVVEFLNVFLPECALTGCLCFKHNHAAD